jgi:hypothetical protein
MLWCFRNRATFAVLLASSHQMEARMQSSQDAFAQRIARINAKAVNTNATLYVGMEDTIQITAAMRKRRPKRRGGLRYTLMMLVCGLGVGGAVLLRDVPVEHWAALVPASVMQHLTPMVSAQMASLATGS